MGSVLEPSPIKGDVKPMTEIGTQCGAKVCGHSVEDNPALALPIQQLQLTYNQLADIGQQPNT